jgi:hypothetical protein
LDAPNGQSCVQESKLGSDNEDVDLMLSVTRVVSLACQVGETRARAICKVFLIFLPLICHCIILLFVYK